MPKTEIRKRQIWREVDPRFERYVRIVDVGNDVIVRSVVFDGTLWVDKPKSREAYAKLTHFNGKRGGYDFYMDAP